MSTATPEISDPGTPEAEALCELRAVGKGAALSVLCERYALERGGWRDGRKLHLVSVVAHQSALKALHGMLNGKGSAEFTFVDGAGRTRAARADARYRRAAAEKLDYNLWHALFLSREPGLMAQVSDAALWRELKSGRYTTPLHRSWVPYLRGELERLGLLVVLDGWQCRPGLLTATDADLDALVSAGLRGHAVRFPGAPARHAGGSGLAGCAGLDDFFTRYGPEVGRQVTGRLQPLHRPGVDPLLVSDAPYAEGGPFLRPLFEPQAHVATAAARVLDRQRFCLVVGEVGTGKTFIGMAAAHAHARGAGYRGLVVCPDHLCAKWERELKATIPGVRVHRLRRWQDVLRLCPGTPIHRHVRWRTPAGPHWYVMGRDRAKLGPGWEVSTLTRRCAVDVPGPPPGGGDVAAGKALRPEDAGRVRPRACCPACGAPVVDRDGLPLDAADLPKSKHLLRCRAKVAKLTGEGDDPPGWKEVECGSVLWQNVARPRRLAPERVINQRLRGFFRYFILDEAHEEKGAQTAQATAASAIAAASTNVLAMTGTLIGGYANHLFHLLMRFAPRTLTGEGLGWGDSLEFSRRYGRVDRITTEKKKASASNRQSRGGGAVEVKEKPAPGVMPTLYGRHLLDKAVFLTLDQLAADLPPKDERLVEARMDPELEDAYGRLRDELTGAIKQMVAAGDTRLLGAYLEALLYYPDHPYGWGDIGYTDRDSGAFVTVARPRSLDPRVVRPKEAAFRDLCRAERAGGNQTWGYVQRTGERDTLDRLARVLAGSGQRAGVLRSSVPREKREDWIRAQGRSFDVMLSHPQLVETGLDLFSTEPGGHNYSTLCFYQTGYRTFQMRQAAGRARRIGQWKPCKVRYLYYAGTMQETALHLMALKLKASLALEGTFSEEGLAAMNRGSASESMDLAKLFCERGGATDVAALWKQVGAAEVVRPVPSPEGPPTRTRVVAPVPAPGGTLKQGAFPFG